MHTTYRRHKNSSSKCNCSSVTIRYCCNDVSSNNSSNNNSNSFCSVNKKFATFSCVSFCCKSSFLNNAKNYNFARWVTSFKIIPIFNNTTKPFLLTSPCNDTTKILMDLLVLPVKLLLQFSIKPHLFANENSD